MPRAKKAKQYRKLMQKFALNFGFREPYQVLVDSELITDACRFKMDLVKGLEQTLSGKVKPMICQCDIRHLYATKSQPGVEAAIDLAKTFERRRCGHHPDTYPEPLSSLECLTSVVDPKSGGINRHKYIIASNSSEVRAAMRQVKGVPLIYISRSVMIMEPMASASIDERSRDETSKFRAEIKKALGKRKREGDGETDTAKAPDTSAPEAQDDEATEPQVKKQKKIRGPKGPNPLSMKKRTKTAKALSASESREAGSAARASMTDGVDGSKKKRKRKHKKPADPGSNASGEASVMVETGAGDAVDTED